MAVDIREDAAATVTLLTGAGWLAADCTVAVYDPDGTLIATPRVAPEILADSTLYTCDQTDLTCDATRDWGATDPTAVVVWSGDTAIGSTTSATNAYTYVYTPSVYTYPEVGHWYDVDHAGRYHRVRVVAVTAGSGNATVQVYPAPVDTFAASDLWYPAETTVELTSSETADLGAGYQVVVWRASTNDEARAVYHVVRRLTLSSLRTDELRALVQQQWSSADLSETELDDLRLDVTGEIRQSLLTSGRYPYLYADPDVYRAAGIAVALRLLFQRRGLIGPGWQDPRDYVEELRRAEDKALGQILSSYVDVDRDDDGSLDVPDAGWLAIPVLR